MRGSETVGHPEATPLNGNGTPESGATLVSGSKKLKMM